MLFMFWIQNLCKCNLITTWVLMRLLCLIYAAAWYVELSSQELLLLDTFKRLGLGIWDYLSCPETATHAMPLCFACH